MNKKEADKINYLKNRESRLALMKIYYIQNKEKIKQTSKNYYQENKARLQETWNAKSRKQYLLYRDEKLAWHKENHKNKRIEFLTKLGGCVCKKCGYSDWRALQVDHIDGNGHIERKEAKGHGISRKKQEIIISKNPENFQILCANCNWIKKYENKENAKIRIKTQSRT